jgi:hypothetical protein
MMTMMRCAATSVFLVAWTSAGAPVAAESDASMTFALASNGGNCNTCEWISAQGVITPDTPAAFEEFLEGYVVRSPTVTVYFHSPGGELKAGLRLGFMIREANLSTGVGRTVRGDSHWAEVVPGSCLSSCAYAFLGGVDRWIDEADTLGFHQFLPENENVRIKMDALGDEFGLSTSQVWTGLLSAYFQEMGVDAGLLAIASATPFESMYVPTMDKLREFGVVKTPTTWSEWALTYIRGGIALDAERHDSNFPEKARLLCYQNGGVFFISTQEYPSAIQSPGQIRELMTSSISVGDVERELAPSEVIASRDRDWLIVGVRLTEKRSAASASRWWNRVRFRHAPIPVWNFSDDPGAGCRCLAGQGRPDASKLYEVARVCSTALRQGGVQRRAWLRPCGRSRSRRGAGRVRRTRGRLWLRRAR